MYLLLKMVVFHGYVSFREGNQPRFPWIKRDSPSKQLPFWELRSCEVAMILSDIFFFWEDERQIWFLSFLCQPHLAFDAPTEISTKSTMGPSKREKWCQTIHKICIFTNMCLALISADGQNPAPVGRYLKHPVNSNLLYMHFFPQSNMDFNVILRSICRPWLVWSCFHVDSLWSIFQFSQPPHFRG